MKGKRFISQKEAIKGIVGGLTITLALSGFVPNEAVGPLLFISGLVVMGKVTQGIDGKTTGHSQIYNIPTRHERTLAHIRVMEKELGISDPYAEYYQ